MGAPVFLDTNSIQMMRNNALPNNEREKERSNGGYVASMSQTETENPSTLARQLEIDWRSLKNHPAATRVAFEARKEEGVHGEQDVEMSLSGNPTAKDFEIDIRLLRKLPAASQKHISTHGISEQDLDQPGKLRYEDDKTQNLSLNVDYAGDVDMRSPSPHPSAQFEPARRYEEEFHVKRIVRDRMLTEDARIVSESKTMDGTRDTEMENAAPMQTSETSPRMVSTPDTLDFPDLDFLHPDLLRQEPFHPDFLHPDYFESDLSHVAPKAPENTDPEPPSTKPKPKAEPIQIEEWLDTQNGIPPKATDWYCEWCRSGPMIVELESGCWGCGRMRDDSARFWHLE